jgi:hypothetical protein
MKDKCDVCGEIGIIVKEPLLLGNEDKICLSRTRLKGYYAKICSNCFDAFQKTINGLQAAKRRLPC